MLVFLAVGIARSWELPGMRGGGFLDLLVGPAKARATGASPESPAVFKGTTLRGMLLNAYGFWQMGQIAWIGAIVAFAGAALMLILSLLGAWHLRRVPEAAEVFSKASHRAVQTA